MDMCVCVCLSVCLFPLNFWLAVVPLSIYNFEFFINYVIGTTSQKHKKIKLKINISSISIKNAWSSTFMSADSWLLGYSESVNLIPRKSKFFNARIYAFSKCRGHCVFYLFLLLKIIILPFYSLPFLRVFTFFSFLPLLFSKILFIQWNENLLLFFFSLNVTFLLF